MLKGELYYHVAHAHQQEQEQRNRDFDLKAAGCLGIATTITGISLYSHMSLTYFAHPSSRFSGKRGTGPGSPVWLGLFLLGPPLGPGRHAFNGSGCAFQVGLFRERNHVQACG